LKKEEGKKKGTRPEIGIARTEKKKAERPLQRASLLRLVGEGDRGCAFIPDHGTKSCTAEKVCRNLGIFCYTRLKRGKRKEENFWTLYFPLSIASGGKKRKKKGEATVSPPHQFFALLSLEGKEGVEPPVPIGTKPGFARKERKSHWSRHGCSRIARNIKRGKGRTLKFSITFLAA